MCFGYVHNNMPMLSTRPPSFRSSLADLLGLTGDGGLQLVELFLEVEVLLSTFLDLFLEALLGVVVGAGKEVNRGIYYI